MSAHKPYTFLQIKENFSSYLILHTKYKIFFEFFSFSSFRYLSFVMTICSINICFIIARLLWWALLLKFLSHGHIAPNHTISGKYARGRFFFSYCYVSFSSILMSSFRLLVNDSYKCYSDLSIY